MMDKIETAIITLHHQCALRDNASSAIVKAMAQLGKPINDAFAAALLTMGGKHAPIAQAQRYFTRFRMEDVPDLPLIVPGFGSAWYRGEVDPLIDAFLNEIVYATDESAEIVNDLDVYVEYVRKHTGKNIYPNAAMATAVANIAMKRDPCLGMGLVIQGRVAAWEIIYSQHYIERGF